LLDILPPLRQPRGGLLFVARIALLVLIITAFTGGSALAQGDGGGTTTIHVVQRGENLFRIAMRYGTTVDAIVRANGLRDATQIQVGQRLLIPNAAPAAPGDTVPGVPTSYVVQPGDTLTNLSLRYGMSIDALARQNKIVNPQQLFVGQSLSIQEGQNSQPQIKTGWLYTVQPDDNIYRIAARYHLPMDKLVKANAIKRITALYPGQRLVIPGPDDGPALVDLPRLFAAAAMSPIPAEQGRTFMLRLTTAVPTKLEGAFMGKALIVHSDEARTTHLILYGIDSFANPGVYRIELTATDDQGQKSQFSDYLQIADGGYGSEQIILPSDQGDLLDPKVTQPELNQIMRPVSNFSEPRYFNGPMGLPCPAPVTSQYGTRRSYNKGPYDQIHTGTDFACPPGAPIYAPADGVVVFTGSLHVRGNATILDHGWGVYTGYWHQSDIKVKVGDIVRQGQVIGAVGSTGRANGPHLHWEMFIGGVQVDPLQWTRQSFP